MKLPSRFVVIAAATLVITGCSHGTVAALPSAPTPLPATVERLSITPAGGGTMLAGGTAPITTSGAFPAAGVSLGAVAEYTDGSREYVDASWTSSDATVLIVDGAVLRAVGRGTATLTATAKGHSASETFNVDPGIPGIWIGTYVVDQCSAAGAEIYELVCRAAEPGRRAGILPPGTAAPVGFQITQNGTDLSAIAAFGEIRGTLSGTDRGQNFLTLTGDLSFNGTAIKLIHWDARVKTDAMEGFIGFEMRTSGVPSFAQVTGHFVDVTRR